MSALVASILVDAAAKVGAPIVKGLLEKYIGGVGSEIGGAVVDTVAGKLGVPVDEIATKPMSEVEAAVRAAEEAAPQMLLDFATRQHELSNELQKAEMAKDGAPVWTWAWRPAWMWFLLFLWFFRIVVVTTVDAILASSMAAAVPLDALFWLTAVFTGLYMGGHTIKDGISKWLGRAL